MSLCCTCLSHHYTVQKFEANTIFKINYNSTEGFYSNKCCSFFNFIHQRIKGY